MPTEAADDSSHSRARTPCNPVLPCRSSRRGHICTPPRLSQRRDEKRLPADEEGVEENRLVKPVGVPIGDRAMGDRDGLLRPRRRK